MLVSNGLSPQQKEILELLQDNTPKQIAVRRGTTVRAVYKTIKKLKDKGYSLRGFTKAGGSQTSRGSQLSSKKTYIRLHGMQFRIRLLYDSSFYHKSLNKGNFMVVDSHKVMLHKGSVQIYQSESHSFVGADEDRVAAEAFDYWNKFIVKLEHRLKVILLKDGSQSVKLVNAHFAECNNELAGDCREKSRALRVFTRDDGKLWFVIDYSFNVDEAETQHPDTSQVDMTKVRNVFNDYRDNPDSPLPSELSGFVCDNAKAIGGLTSNMEYFGVNMVSHVEAIQTLHRGVDELTGVVSSLKDVVVSSKGVSSESSLLEGIGDSFAYKDFVLLRKLLSDLLLLNPVKARKLGELFSDFL